MPLTCGWPNGSRVEDGFCREIPTVAYLVEVRDVPLISPDDEVRQAVLTLCPKHGPTEEQP